MHTQHSQVPWILEPCRWWWWSLVSLCPQRPSRKVKFAAVESSEPSASCRDSNTDSTDWETSWNTNTTVCLQPDHLSCPIIKGSEHDHVSASLHKLCMVTLFHTKADSFQRFYKSPFLYLHILPTTLPQRVSDGTCRWRCAPNRFINVLWASLKSKCGDGTKYEKPCSWCSSYVRAQQVDIWVSLVSLINIAAFTVSWSAFWQVREQSHNLSQSCTKDTS